jgi:hypothetical protein
VRTNCVLCRLSYKTDFIVFLTSFFTSVSDPDQVSGSGFRIRIRIQVGKKDPQKCKKA